MQHLGLLPSINDNAVAAFTSKWGISTTPTLLHYTNFGYEAAWCHVSAKHKAISSGGKRVHGWALWKFGPDLLADHHSVWETDGGDLVDITPPSNGGTKILFVRDDTARIELDAENIQLFTQRTADASVHWYWLGQPSDYSNWSCPLNKADLVAYSKKLNISVSKIITDDNLG